MMHTFSCVKASPTKASFDRDKYNFYMALNYPTDTSFMSSNTI